MNKIQNYLFIFKLVIYSQDQDQRSELEAESQVRSTSDNVLHAVSIPAYEMHRWKEDSCSPNLDGDSVQGANKILTARPQPCVASVFLCKVGPWPFRGNCSGIRLTTRENHRKL